MPRMDLRMEAVVRGIDDQTMGRVWGMVLAPQGRDTVVTHLQIEGGAFEKNALIPFRFFGWSSDQQVILKVSKAEALAGAEKQAPEGSWPMYRNDPVRAVDARLGHIRGFYVDEQGKISDLVINDEVGCRLGLVSIRTVDEIVPHRIELWARIAEMGDLMKPPQAFYEPVELRSEEELLRHAEQVGSH